MVSTILQMRHEFMTPGDVNTHVNVPYNRDLPHVSMMETINPHMEASPGV